MELNKQQPALLYLDKNGFYFYEEGLTTVISLAFLDNAVKDMEVVNAVSLMNQIKSFVDQYKLMPATITMVLSPNVAFEKDIVDLAREAQEEAVKNFIDTVPFESVLTKSYPIAKGVKVIGFNEDLYLELKNGFEKSSFGIESIIPYQLLGTDQTLIKNLTTDNATQFLKRIGNLKQHTLLVTQKERTSAAAVAPSTPTAVSSGGDKPKKKNTRVFVMAGVFIVLFAILGYMLMNMK